MESEKVKSFRELIVWQRSMEVAKEIFYLCKNRLPKEEIFTLGSQMKRSAISIPSNIAEGHARQYTKEFVNFLSIAFGSAAELETQLLLGKDIGFWDEKQLELVIGKLFEVQKMLQSMQRKLRK